MEVEVESSHIMEARVIMEARIIMVVGIMGTTEASLGVQMVVGVGVEETAVEVEEEAAECCLGTHCRLSKFIEICSIEPLSTSSPYRYDLTGSFKELMFRASFNWITYS